MVIYWGQEIGSVWRHGAYVAPDWTADWLHKEATYMLNKWVNEAKGSTFDKLDEETQAMLKARCRKKSGKTLTIRKLVTLPSQLCGQKP